MYVNYIDLLWRLTVDFVDVLAYNKDTIRQEQNTMQGGTIMKYMDKYPILAWFAYADEAEEYKANHNELVIVEDFGGYAVIKRW